jgi:hypothetical protein
MFQAILEYLMMEEIHFDQIIYANNVRVLYYLYLNILKVFFDVLFEQLVLEMRRN